MNQNNVAIAEAFYTAFREKNIEAMEKYLHPEIQFFAPLAKLQGKEAYLEAAKNFASFFKTLTLRVIFGEEHQAAVVYDVECPAPIGKLPSVALMDIQEGLIIRIELFYDARPFDKS
jgi:hypothetical protein